MIPTQTESKNRNNDDKTSKTHVKDQRSEIKEHDVIIFAQNYPLPYSSILLSFARDKVKERPHYSETISAKTPTKKILVKLYCDLLLMRKI